MPHRSVGSGTTVLVALALSTALTACPATARRPAPPGPAAPAPETPAAPAPDTTGDVAPAAEATRNERLAEVARRVPGVRNAWVVAVGETAYVGLDLDGEHRRTAQANAAIERQVADALRRSPHGIRTALVTTKPEVVQSIFNVAEALRRGQPFAQLAAELDKIANEMLPAARQ